MGASRVKMYCDEISIIRTVNLEMTNEQFLYVLVEHFPPVNVKSVFIAHGSNTRLWSNYDFIPPFEIQNLVG